MLLQSIPTSTSDALFLLGVAAVLCVVAGIFILVFKFIQKPGEKQDVNDQRNPDP